MFALDLLKRWAANDENNPVPSTRLVNMLLEDHNPAEALIVAEGAIKDLPEDKKKDETLQLELGRAQLKAGRKDKGRTTLVALMQSSENSLILTHAKLVRNGMLNCHSEICELVLMP